MRLTDLSIKRLVVPPTGQRTYTDDTLPGFGVRVSSAGTKSFVLVHGRSRRRITIGRYPTITLAKARARARELVAERVLGKEDLPTIKFEDALPVFLASQYPEHSLKPRTRVEAERVLKRHFLPPFRHELLHTITTHEVMRIVDRLAKTPSEARHAFALIRVFFNWAERRRYVSKSPCHGVKPPRSAPPRERVLTREEIKAVLAAARASDSTIAVIIELLLYTGQRRGEIAGLRAEWIDWEKRLIMLPASATKNKRAHAVPFGDRVEELLRNGHSTGFLFRARGTDTPFFGWSKCKPKFNLTCPLLHWTLHDLRRTFATNLAALGVSLPVTEKLLNHVSGSFDGIVSVYQRYGYEKEMREAITLWERYLNDLTREPAAAGERVQTPHLRVA
jgi:integrase